jgi:uncharacterized protein (TIGR03435 family)
MSHRSFISVKSPSLRFALVAFALLPATGLSQSPASRPQFDAASIRVNRSSDRPSTQYDAGRVTLHKASFKHLVRRGWPLPDYQIVWPASLPERGQVGYDVSVTFPPDTSPERLQLMFQDLLTTRFGLVMHWETHELRAYEVSISNRGLRLHEAANPAPPTDYPKYSTKIVNGEWLMSSKLGAAPSGLTVAGFLEMISTMRILDRPLIDATGINGYYDIDLTAPVDVPENKPSPSDLLGALDKELGLKATPKTLQLLMLVVDHLEQMPTEN